MIHSFHKMKNTFFAILSCVTAILATGCAKTEPADTAPSAADVVMQLQSADRLYVSEYIVHKIITAEDLNRVRGSLLGYDFTVDLAIGQRKIAIPMDASIKAYIDFGTVTESDIVVTDNPPSVAVTLPEPKAELVSSKIAHDEIKEFRGIFRSRFSDAEISELERQGREVILAAIPRMGIVNTAKANAREVLIPILAQAGFAPENITVNFKD